jgi:predicted enzyme related to lactoylglutathione lyase
MTGLLKVDNIMYRVSDLSTATNFYVSHLGVAKAWEDEEQRMVGLKLRDSDSEIVLHANPDLPAFDYSFLVDNVKRLCTAFSRAGGDVVTQPLRVRTGWYAVLRDDDGNTLPIIDLSEFGGEPRYG